MKMSKFDAIQKFIRSAPGFCLSNYSSRAQYQADWRKADKARDRARRAWHKVDLEKLIAEIDAGRPGSALYWNPDGSLGYHVYGYGPVEKFKRFAEVAERIISENKEE